MNLTKMKFYLSQPLPIHEKTIGWAVGEQASYLASYREETLEMGIALVFGGDRVLSPAGCAARMNRTDGIGWRVGAGQPIVN